MNQDQKELTLEESIKEVMQTLPPLIKKSLSEGRYTAVAKDLMVKYGLRIDQGGVLEREIMLLLMGIESPDEFTTALVEEAKIDQKNIAGIVQDINTQIFIPLQEEERKSSEKEKVQPAKPAAPVAPRENVVMPLPRSVIIPANPRMPGSTTEEDLSEKWLRPTSIATKNPQEVQQINPKYIPPRPAPNVIQNAPRPVVSTAPKPPANEKFLEDHEEPHIEFNKTPMPPVRPRTAPPPNLPGAMLPPGEILGISSSPNVPKIEKPTPIIQPKPAPNTAQVTPVPSKPYSIDPYREPIDETDK